MAADTYDVITLVEAYRAINDPTSAAAGTGANDDMLESFITTTSNRLDELVGPIVNRTVTEYHDGGVSTVWPRQTPVSSVTTLKEYDGSTTTTLTAETFGNSPSDAHTLVQSASYSHDHQIVRRNGGANTFFASGLRNVELVYVAGRAANTAAVPTRYKMAAGAILRRLWDREASAWARSDNPFDEGGGSRFFDAVTQVVKEQLGDEMKPSGLA